ncbi:MAG TPA: PASTA domain-containing protein [Limnochordia bacterium]|nr:PASTA domain-containing protein [Limnochordia bacterium]
MDGNGRYLEPSETPDFIGYEWDEAESLAAELGVKVVRVATDDESDAPQRVVRQVRRGDVIELLTVAEIWTL